MAIIVGCDLGKASASFIIAEQSADGRLQVKQSTYVSHEGDPFGVFCRWYRENDVAGAAAMGATGLYADQLAPPVMAFPEDACQEATLEADANAPDTMYLVSVGARGYSVLSRLLVKDQNARSNGRSFHYRYLENDKCSSGAGENILKIVSRFGLTVDEADRLAGAAANSIPITARCSVFAKSEMTHYANQGRPTSELLNGFFSSMARNTGALLSKNQTDGPIYLIGGLTRIQSFIDAFSDAIGQDAVVPANRPYWDWIWVPPVP